jgi:hypothetical protein
MSVNAKLLVGRAALFLSMRTAIVVGSSAKVRQGVRKTAPHQIGR